MMMRANGGGVLESMDIRDKEGSNLENISPTSGAGVVRIHLLNLKNRTITCDRYFKLKKHHDPGHIRLNSPSETFRLLDTQLSEYGERLNKERTVFQDKAKSKIMEKMTNKAIELGMTFHPKTGVKQNVATCSHICTAWKQDNGCSELQKKMHLLVCVGCFEKNWDQMMEAEIMKSSNMAYNVTTSGRNKGCILVLFSYERSKLVKRINRRAGASGNMITEKGNKGYKIRVSRTKEERHISGETRRKARDFLAPLEVWYELTGWEVVLKWIIPNTLTP
jgi:hypothetical protein